MEESLEIIWITLDFSSFEKLSTPKVWLIEQSIDTKKGMVFTPHECCILKDVTGEAYCTSVRMAYELLKRNLLAAVFVETLSTHLLAGIILVFSSIYAIVICALLNAVSNLWPDSYSVAARAWVLMMVVLGFFVHVLDNVIDMVYLCHAIDRDRGEVRKQEVHEVYVHLPISMNHGSSLVPRVPLNV
ncbi:hypothetical protein CsSME_00025621 [Camellia sinensis var. sinensis]